LQIATQYTEIFSTVQKNHPKYKTNNTFIDRGREIELAVYLPQPREKNIELTASKLFGCLTNLPAYLKGSNKYSQFYNIIKIKMDKWKYPNGNTAKRRKSVDWLS